MTITPELALKLSHSCWSALSREMPSTFEEPIGGVVRFIVEKADSAGAYIEVIAKRPNVSGRQYVTADWFIGSKRASMDAIIWIETNTMQIELISPENKWPNPHDNIIAKNIVIIPRPLK